MAAVIVGERAATVNFQAHQGEDWTYTVQLLDEGGAPWDWTGKHARMVLARRRSGGVAVVSIDQATGLDISVAGYLGIAIDFDDVPPYYYRCDVVETVISSGKDRPILTGWFDVEGSTT